MTQTLENPETTTQECFDWVPAQLADLVEIKHGWPFKSEFFSEDLTGRPIVIGVGNFCYTGGFRFDSTTIKEYRADYPNEFALAPNDILVVMTCQTSGGEILGIPGRIPDDGRVYLHNQRLGKARILQPKKLDDKFLYWLFRWPAFNRHLYVTSSGTKILHTAPKRIEAFRFLLPPLCEQRAIAHVLDLLDDRIGLNRRMNETLEQIARAIFKSWFVDFDPVRAKSEGRQPPGLDPQTAALFPDSFTKSELGDIPTGWRVASVPDEIDFLEGPGLRNWQYKDVGMKFLNIRCIADGDLDIAKANSIGIEEFSSTYSHFALREDDIVISTSGTLGRLAIVRSDHLPLMLNTSIIRMRGRNSVGLVYVWGFLQSSYFLDEMLALASGSVQLNFGPMHLKKIKILRPPDQLLGCFEDLVRPMIKRALHGRQESCTLAAIRDALLPKLLSGEIRIRDAEKIVATTASKREGCFGQRDQDECDVFWK